MPIVSEPEYRPRHQTVTPSKVADARNRAWRTGWQCAVFDGCATAGAVLTSTVLYSWPVPPRDVLWILAALYAKTVTVTVFAYAARVDELGKLVSGSEE